jgi:hypothetical protein
LLVELHAAGDDGGSHGIRDGGAMELTRGAQADDVRTRREAVVLLVPPVGIAAGMEEDGVTGTTWVLADELASGEQAAETSVDVRLGACQRVALGMADDHRIAGVLEAAVHHPDLQLLTGPLGNLREGSRRRARHPALEGPSGRVGTCPPNELRHHLRMPPAGRVVDRVGAG